MWSFPSAAQLLDGLCIVDDPQFELETLGAALIANPGDGRILRAYVSVRLRSGEVVADRGDCLGEAARQLPPERRARLLSWRTALEALQRGSSGDLTTMDDPVVARARRWLTTGGDPTPLEPL
ncbi:MAG: hypothetical protein JNJ54_02075 [Myxococcaceae bacterium]|nr:hypothetical protein [Myxococcaceae bacterium]